LFTIFEAVASYQSVTILVQVVFRAKCFHCGLNTFQIFDGVA